MKSVKCTLICDGSSDKMLIPSIKWLLVEYYPNIPFDFEYADTRHIISNSKTFAEKICLALEFYPCDILFIQRDTEKETYTKRLVEIKKHISKTDCDLPKIIPVIPQRMSESWLLFDKNAIRKAAANINGNIKLKLPKISQLESLPNPKADLIKLISQATELNKRRLKTFNPYSAIHTLANSIEDYSPLRKLNSFCSLENEIKNLNI